MFREIVDALFPPQCASCRAVGSGLCYRCVPIAMAERRLESCRVRALGSYEGALRSAVLAVKDGRRDVARALGERLGRLLAADAMVVPVPTTRARIRTRGVDGVRLMAQTAAGAHVLPVLHIASGDAQRGRSREARIAAKGRFWCDPDALGGCDIVLLDDVCTTGATLEDCAHAIRAAGGSISAAVVAALA